MDPTIFHVTHWKAGSQWIRAVLEEAAPERIVPPQSDQAHVFNAPIIPGGIYTPVYAGEEQLRSVVPASLDHRTFVVIRDPRDTLVSYYYSLLYSHGTDWDTVGETRHILQEVDKTDGLAILLRNELADVINVQMTWLQAGSRRIFRYEDLLRDEYRGFRDIFEYCNIDVKDSRLREIVAKHSFERVAGRKPGECGSQVPPRATARPATGAITSPSGSSPTFVLSTAMPRYVLVTPHPLAHGDAFLPSSSSFQALASV